MQQEIVITIVQQIMTIVGAVIASGWITNAIVQLLKIDFFKKLGKKWPVQTSIATSVGVSGAAIYTLNLVLLTNWITYVVFAAGTLFVATVSYDAILKKILESNTSPVDESKA